MIICILSSAHDLIPTGLCTGRILSHGFRANVVGYDLYPNEAAAKENGIKYVSLDELFRTADIISLHCPLTPETKYIVNEEVLKTTKPGIESYPIYLTIVWIDSSIDRPGHCQHQSRRLDQHSRLDSRPQIGTHQRCWHGCLRA